MTSSHRSRAAPRPRSPIVLLVLALAALSQLTSAKETFTDAIYRNNPNENATLVVFIAGLGGEGSWTRLTELMDSDEDLKVVDYLVYHSPDSRDIEENVSRAKTILSRLRDRYGEIVYVGHSIGGIMIKRTLLEEARSSPDSDDLPSMVITFGTPIDTDKFSISLFKQLGARIFWFALPRLEKEVFDLERLKEINAAWRSAVGREPIKGIKLVNIFGVQDDIAPVDEEGRSRDTVFIKGDHLGIITPAGTEECSWIVFRTVLLERATDPRTISCVERIPSADGGDSRG